MKSHELELDFAIKMANDAGKIMLKYFRSDEINTQWKDNHTPITRADQKINDLLIERVEKDFPNHGVIGEEGSFMEERDLVWVVDPIDGTSPYILGIPTSTFCLALVSRTDGLPLIAVVYDPFLDDMYTATKNKGAFLNDRPIKTKDATSLHHNYLAVNAFAKKMKDGKVVIRPGKLMEKIRSGGGKCLTFQSHVYTAMKVASGELIGSILAFGSPWDSAAASLIVQEAGGQATDLEGKQRRYDQFGNGTVVAANEKILKILIEEIKKSNANNRIDPGTGIVGFGVIESNSGKFKMIDAGVIRTPSKEADSERLKTIYNELDQIIKETSPDVMAVEKLFFAQNVTTAMTVSQARGVIMLCGSKNNLPVFEYTPLQIKQSITGYGKADKSQVQQMVKVVLNLDSIPKPDDCADALACAVTHGMTGKVA